MMKGDVMLDAPPRRPPHYDAIRNETDAIGFTMASDLWTGALLRTLAASKPGGSFLELGTGTGLATVWLVDGMDARSTLLTVDNDDAVSSVARRHLKHDRRVTFTIADGEACLSIFAEEGRTFDLVFADAWPGKYSSLEEALQIVAPGGLYVVDDMLPQPNWPEDHPPKVARLVETLRARPDLHVATLCWSTGVIVATKRAGNEST
jgi:predicted O-methyltransferase YrrM